MSTLVELIKKTENHVSVAGKPITVEADGVDVMVEEKPEYPEEAIGEIIAEHKPRTLKVWFLRPNGERNGRVLYRKDHHHNNWMAITDPRAENTMNGISDAIVEEENGQPVKASSPLAPQASKSAISTNGLTVDGFAYQMTAAQLAEAKARIQVLESENKTLDKDNTAKDRTILQLENKVDALTEKAESGKGLSGIISEVGKNPEALQGIIQSIPALLGTLKGIGGGRPMAGGGNMHPELSEIGQYIMSLPGESREEVLAVISSALAMYAEGKQDIFARLQSVLVAQQAQQTASYNGGSSFEQKTF